MVIIYLFNIKTNDADLAFINFYLIFSPLLLVYVAVSFINKTKPEAEFALYFTDSDPVICNNLTEENGYLVTSEKYKHDKTLVPKELVVKIDVKRQLNRE